MNIITRIDTVKEKQVVLTKPPLIYPADYQSYLYDASKATTTPMNGNIDVPLVIDTEYQSQTLPWSKGQSSRQHLTTQIMGIHESQGEIYVNPRYKNQVAWKPVETDFHPIDHLRNRGYDVSLRKADKTQLKGLNRCRFVLYAHFALAEFGMIVSGDIKRELLTIAENKTAYGKKIEFKRHLNLYTEQNRNGHKRTLPYVELDYIITIDGVDYALALGYHDTVALHGTASYKDLCANVGIPLKYKDNFDPKKKSDMENMMLTRPQDFENYALGDLEVYQILVNYAEKIKEVYNLLGIPEYFTPPRKTIGATVKDLFTAKLAKTIGIDRREFNKLQNDVLSKSSASSLKRNVKTTACLLSKVNGGRCRNNRPTDVFVNKPLADIDISGCYGEGQRVQDYPVGKPLILSFPTDSDVNDYWPLDQFLKVFGDELIPGLWVARVSFPGTLKYKQDYFVSWFLPNGHGEDIMAKYLMTAKNDTEKQETDEFDEEDGNLKILQHQIHNAVLTHDDLQWILNVASTRQRKELLTGLMVKAAVIFPKSKRVSNHGELLEAYKNHGQKNTVEWKGRGKNKRLHYKDGECHAWYSLNMGGLIIDELLFNRKQHPKKTPLNTLFKLCTNTLYGDMTSKYFDCANTVVGNNITARARSLAWYMEKGFNGFQTITDGCTFELNRVVYPVDPGDFNATYLVDVYKDSANKRIKLSPLGGYDSILLDWEENTPVLTLIKGDIKTILKGFDALKWIDKTAMIHLQTLFPGVDVLHKESTSISAEQKPDGQWEKVYKHRKGQFEFETKSVYVTGVFHGTSNYSLLTPDYPSPCSENVKMRSYETKKPHRSVGQSDEKLIETDRYGESKNPAIDLLTQLQTNPKAIQRQVPFIKTGIVKMGDYVQRIKTYEAMGLEPGDTVNKSGMLRELSLSQFTFKTFEQWKAWNKEYERMKEKYGQSFEMFYLNEDGTLDYKAMVKDIDAKIKSQEPGLSADEYRPLKLFDAHENRWRKMEVTMDHPNHQLRNRLTAMLKEG